MKKGKRGSKVVYKNYDAQMQELQSQKMHYQMTGQYQNAQKTYKKIEALKECITEISSKKIKSKQNKQLSSLKKEQKSIMEQFELDWKKRLNLFENKCYKKSMKDLKKSQEKELAQFHDELEYKLNQKNMKFPPYILEQRSRELALARQNKFKEAFDTQQHRIYLEKIAFQDYCDSLKDQYLRIVSNKKTEHLKQTENLTKRLENSRDELMREYNQQKDLLIKRHSSIMKNFKFNQKKAKNKLSEKNRIRLTKTYVGSIHGHKGTVSHIRPWTFRENDKLIKSPSLKRQHTFPNEDITEMQNFMVNQYQKENGANLSAFEATSLLLEA